MNIDERSMTINERVKHFRKDILKMNQTEFALKLGMKQTGISYMERNGSTVTDQTIKTLELIFKLNENWVRYGIEPMYIQMSTFNLDEFVKQKGASDEELQIIKSYFEIDQQTRKKLIQHFKNHLTSTSLESHPKTDLSALSINERVELYRKELEREEKVVEKSEVS